MEDIEFREIKLEIEMLESAKTISQSFMTVAKDFDISKKDCPRYAAYINHNKLKASRAKGDKLFGFYLNKKQIGFVSLEKATDTVWYLMKLSVLPEYRKNGYGEKLMDFVINHVKKNNGKLISTGVMDKNQKLKNWFKKFGFEEGSKRDYDHIPFTICFMEKEIT